MQVEDFTEKDFETSYDYVTVVPGFSEETIILLDDVQWYEYFLVIVECRIGVGLT